RLAGREDREVRLRRGEGERVQAIEHPAMAAEEAARVLDVHVALQQRLEQVADGRRDRDHEAEDDRLAYRQKARLVERDERDEDRCGRAEDEAFPRLAR